jgi:hypothetical protein
VTLDPLNSRCSRSIQLRRPTRGRVTVQYAIIVSRYRTGLPRNLISLYFLTSSNTAGSLILDLAIRTIPKTEAHAPRIDILRAIGSRADERSRS